MDSKQLISFTCRSVYGPFKRERCDASSVFGDRPPPLVHNAHREGGKARDGGATSDDSSDSKLQLPRMETRKLAHGKKRRKRMRLNLRLDGGQMTSGAKEYVIKDIIGEDGALSKT